MNVKPLKAGLVSYLKRHNLQKKYEKQVKLFSENPYHPSLHTEILEPKHRKLYSLRIDRKYRVIFSFTLSGDVEVVDINDHYQ